MLKNVFVTLNAPTINFHFDCRFHNDQNIHIKRLIKLREAKVQIILLNPQILCKKKFSIF